MAFLLRPKGDLHVVGRQESVMNALFESETHRSGFSLAFTRAQLGVICFPRLHKLEVIQKLLQSYLVKLYYKGEPHFVELAIAFNRTGKGKIETPISLFLHL